MQQIPHKYDRLANLLEEDLGQCPAGRQALLSWIQTQFERAERVPKAPASAVAAMIDSSYVRWCAELLELDQQTAFGAMPMQIPDDFDEMAADDIQEMFESSETFPDREQPADQEREILGDEKSD